jgi:hypothetical protein
VGEFSMLGVSNVGLLAGLAAFAVTVTLLANWMVAGFGKPSPPSRFGSVEFVGFLANTVWIALVFASGVIALRYSERLEQPVFGLLVFASLSLAGSVLRALLARRVPASRAGQLYHGTMHLLVYLLAGVVAYLLLALLFKGPVLPVLLLPLLVGALLPCLDSRMCALAARVGPVADRRFEKLQESCEWKSLAGAVVVTILALPLALIANWQAWLLVPLGFLSHLLIDLLRPEGVVLFWPISHRRFVAWGRVEKHHP